MHDAGDVSKGVTPEVGRKQTTIPNGGHNAEPTMVVHAVSRKTCAGRKPIQMDVCEPRRCSAVAC